MFGIKNNTVTETTQIFPTRKDDLIQRGSDCVSVLFINFITNLPFDPEREYPYTDLPLVGKMGPLSPLQLAYSVYARV